MKIPGYLIQESSALYESDTSVVYRAIREGDGLPVIVKMLNKEYPSVSEINRFSHEFKILSGFDSEGIIRAHGLEKHQNTRVMVLEDFGGESLARILPGRPLDMKTFLALAIKIAGILGTIHQRNIIHKDLNPNNILWNPETDQVKIIDFSLSTELSMETPELKNLTILEGTLPYMSPEQTGRMNRSLDYLTDFYSLGVTFYEMLTGTRPFQTLDPMELVYSHIAKTPASPREYNPKIPGVVSAIIMKLMSKVAEERYHSAFGLKHDLEKCLDQYLLSGTIEPFDIGVNDFSEKFTIPQTLYGREHEIERLLSAYQRVCLGKKELMLVAGTPGVGKSALVNEIHKPITGNRAYFISGKFDQFQRNIPYAPLIQAFQGLIRQILTQKAAEIRTWKETLEDALGANAQVIIDVIPEVERITGRQPALPELAPSEAQHRFNITFLNFVRVFTGQGRPLVLFLDDLQWADLPSLKLIELIMCDRKRQHIFLIVSYRDTEVDPSHPLMLTVEEIRKTGIGIHAITLKPLKLEHVRQIIDETVGQDTETTLPLSELCLEKTRGNPFFLRQFLLSLHHEHFIEFNRQETRWQWDLQRIKDAEITDNVVDLLIGKINYLPANTRQVLKLASVIGATFDLNTLAAVHEKKPLETAEDVWPALKEGLVITSDEAFGFMEDVDAGDTMSYRFLHDRVQQAAYSLIDEDKKTEAHLKIGRLLLNSLRESEPDDLLFDMTNHLNLGKSLITDPRERIRLIGMNLRAGIKAKSSAAYAPSLAYLQEGIDLLGKDGWKEETCDLSLQLYTEATEAAYLNADFSEMNRMADETLRHASRITETVKIYETRIQAFRALNRNIEAVDTTYDVLRLLSLKLPQKITLGHLALALIKTRLAYAGKKKEEILSLPEMTDPSSLAIVRIATSSATALFSSGHDKEVGLLVLKLLNLFLKRGNAGQSAYWYSLYGMVLCSFNAFDLGNHFGSIASELMNRPNAKAIKSRVMFIVNIFIFHWKNHLRSTLPPLIEAYQLGYETGDIEFIAWNGYTYCMHSYFCGRRLQELDREMALYGDVMERYKQESVLNYTRVFRQAVLNLQGKSDNPIHLKGESYDEDVMKEAHVKAKDRTGSYAFHMHKLILCYLFEDYKAAEEHAAMAKKYLNSVTTLYAFLEFYFYRALIRLATLGDAPAASRKKKLKKIDYSLKKLKKWAELAPMNNQHKYDLVMAEKARVEGHRLAALDFYKAAIKGARENQYLQEEAMASERVARYYLEQGFDREAEAYIREARYLYQQWGALAKVAHLDRQFPDLFFRGQTSAPEDNDVLSSYPKSREPLGSGNIDLGAVMKATQAISGEIDLESLISKLMAIIIENAGAERGFLIIRDEKTERLLIRAEKTATSDDIRVLIPEDVDGCRRLSQNMVHYAFHAQAEIVLHDATRDGDFTGDAYVTREHPKSILCFPIVRHGKSMGIIYLENNLTAGAFTADRLKVLQILSSQASISLANAELYDGMKESEKKYRDIFENSTEGIFHISYAGRCINANNAGAEMLGYSSPMDMISSVTDISRQVFADPSTTHRFMDLIKANGTLMRFEVECLRKDGAPLWGNISARTMYHEDGRVDYFEITAVDITEKKKSEAEILKLNQELEQRVADRTRQLNQTLETVSMTNEELEAYKAKMTDSLNYAELIQRSLLPGIERLKPLSPESLFIWMPKDIVGGDIYYTYAAPEASLIVVMDCTGHGVPGAFLTMLVYSEIRNIIIDDACREPSVILKKLSRSIKKSLHANDESNANEGLDAAVCRLDYGSRSLVYAGARIPLFYVKDQTVYQVKGDKQSLGYKDSDTEFHFTDHVIHSDGTCSFYIPTDGYIDQLGGEGRRRFGSKNFKQLLLATHTQPFSRQRKTFLEALKAHQGQHEQVDDITLVGFKY